MTVRISLSPLLWKALLIGLAAEILTGVVPLALLMHYEVPADAGWPYLVTQMPGLLVLVVFGVYVSPHNQAWLNPLLMVCSLGLQIGLFAVVAETMLNKFWRVRQNEL